MNGQQKMWAIIASGIVVMLAVAIMSITYGADRSGERYTKVQIECIHEHGAWLTNNKCQFFAEAK